MSKINIESQVQQQKEQSVNFEKKQVKTNETNANRDKLVADRLLSDAKESKEQGNEEESTTFSTKAGHNYITAVQKLGKANIEARGKESSTYDKKINGKIIKEKVVKTHSIRVINKELGGNAILNENDSAKMDNITNESGLDYINLEHGNRDGEVVSLSIEQAETLKNINDKAFANYNKQKEEEKKKQEQIELDKTVSEQMKEILGY